MVECDACDNEASGTCVDCDISVCDDHYCLMTCESTNCWADVCMACATTNESEIGPCCDSCSSTTTCDCGNWESDMGECGDGCGSKCSECLTSCWNCEYFCCREFTTFQGNDVCVECAEGLRDALGDHFAAGAEHDQWNEGQG